jgi:hypothetical protein
VERSRPVTTFVKLYLLLFQSLGGNIAQNPWWPSGTIELEDVDAQGLARLHRHLVHPRL